MGPKYAELTRTLIKEIAEGIYPVGHSLPKEIELAEQYNVSRSTLRAALQRLQELGLISRRKKAGTRVESMHLPEVRYSPQMSTLEELIDYHLNTERTIHDMQEIVVDIELSYILGCKPGEHWLKLLTSRAYLGSQGVPVSWSDVYIRASTVKNVHKQLKKTDLLICEFISKITGRTIKEIRQTISAVGVPKHLADTFKVKVESHALEIVRQYFDEGGMLFQVVISVHPADRFSYRTTLFRASLEKL